MMVASTKSATVLRIWAVMMIVFLLTRSAITPPASENSIDGSMDDNITQVSARGEFVMS